MLTSIIEVQVGTGHVSVQPAVSSFKLCEDFTISLGAVDFGLLAQGAAWRVLVAKVDELAQGHTESGRVSPQSNQQVKPHTQIKLTGCTGHNYRKMIGCVLRSCGVPWNLALPVRLQIVLP